MNLKDMKIKTIFLWCLVTAVTSDSVYITSPKGGSQSPKSSSNKGVHDCVSNTSMRIHMDAVQDFATETKRISLSVYEYVRDVLTHAANIKTMIRTVTEKVAVQNTLASQILNNQDNMKDYLPQYVTNTNSRLYVIEQTQATLQSDLDKLKDHIDVRLNKLEEMIVASSGLSQTAIITYSVVVLVSITIILVGALWFISYFAINANPETPFIQRLAQNIWRGMNLHAHSSVIVHASPAMSEMPPSYSSVDVSMTHTME